MRGTGFIALRSLPLPVQKIRARVGEGKQNLAKKKKAACSNRLLPKGYHGDGGARRPHRGRLGDHSAFEPGKRGDWGEGEQVVDIIWKGLGQDLVYMMPLGGPQSGPRSTPFFI